jgi:hypothetical protein
MPDLRPSLRIHAVVIAALFAATVAFVTMDRTEQTSTRLFFGVLGIGISITLIYAYRKETMLAHDHMIVAGTITEIKTRLRRRQMIKYKFLALNGLEYTGESDWEKRTTVGAEIIVLYKPLQPSVNQPRKRFLFYSFEPYGC